MLFDSMSKTVCLFAKLIHSFQHWIYSLCIYRQNWQYDGQKQKYIDQFLNFDRFSDNNIERPERETKARIDNYFFQVSMNHIDPDQRDQARVSWIASDDQMDMPMEFEWLVPHELKLISLLMSTFEYGEQTDNKTVRQGSAAWAEGKYVS